MSWRSFFREAYDRRPPEDERLWHKWTPFWPWVRLINGSRASYHGQIWRRRGADGRWQYRQDEETDDEWSGRQW